MQATSTSSLNTRAALYWKLPILALGIALIATIWGAIWMQVASERRAMVQSITQETSNLALVFEQNTERTASEIDRIIRYLRASYERQGFRADWPTLVLEEFTSNRRTVQIAVMDATGMMITSSKMLHPKKPVDLSDREHFRVHAAAPGYTDRLFISKPVLGRASKKWSVQFTRPYADANGKFAGVIVVSLDPDFLTRNFAALKLGSDGGLAIIGEDRIVRAGAGSFKKVFSKPIAVDIVLPADSEADPNTHLKLTQLTNGPLVTVVRKLKDFPLTAIIARGDAPMFSAWEENRRKYIWGGGTLTVAIVLALMMSLIRRRIYERQLSHLARHDGLTDLLNRRAFSERLTKHLKSGSERSFAVLLVDLDCFKNVNDTFGHPVGDQLLINVSQRLRFKLSKDDTLARLGGDEFAILIERSACRDAAAELAGQLCGILSVHYMIDGQRIEIGASIGIVSGHDDFEDEDQLMRSADLALYASKNAGGRTYRIYDKRMDEEAQARREIESGLRYAIDFGQLEVHYQPIYNTEDLDMQSVEALIRWRHPEKGMIPPGAFIPVAEQTGMIVEIGSWVMERACIEVATRSPTLEVAVNVSAIEFRDGDVASGVRQAITRSGIDPTRLKVEITESLLMSKDLTTLDQLDRIRKLGVRISMDDFGTGFSSLSYLQSYPIDCIKIDRAFVNGLETSSNSEAIIEAIARLAKAMGMTTVAEGVETERQLEMLKEIGCAQAQGFLLSRPKPIDEIFPEYHAEEADADPETYSEREREHFARNKSQAA